MINEQINLGKDIFVSKVGKEHVIIFINPNTSENVYNYKEIIKKYGGEWDSFKKRWKWFVFSTDEDVIKKTIDEKVRPALSEIYRQKKFEESEIVKVVNDIISKLSSNPDVTADPSSPDDDVDVMSNDQIKLKLEGFKRDLIKSMSDAEFKAKLDYVLKFRKAIGREFSFMNTILIIIQKPNAKLVKSKSNWLAINRKLVEKPKGIRLTRPKTVPVLGKEKEEVIRKYLNNLGLKSEKDLSIKQREILNTLLQKTVKTASGMPLFMDYFVYDITETVQIEGTEDLVGDPNAEIPWYTEGEEDELAGRIYDEMLNIAKNDYKLTINIVDDLGGSRGVSKSGTIEILKNSGKDVGMTKTLIHEVSHELLHQNYVHSQNPKLKEFFVGKEIGRDKVEQQAELCAWVVMKNFGFDTKTSINYIGLWGADDKTVIPVFDTIARLASVLIDKLEKRIKPKNKGELKEEDVFDDNNISGYELAKMVGLGDFYKEQENAVKQEREQLKESFYTILRTL